MNEKRIQQLEDAVKAEKQEQETLYRSQLQLSPGEQRKAGIALFPLTIVSQEEAGSYTVVAFRTSFPINETYFRKGCQVRCSQGNWSAPGRLLELDATSGTFSLSDEDVPLLREEPVILTYLLDDRTMTCMELGIRLLQNHAQLQVFHQNVEQESLSFDQFTIGNENWERPLNPSQQVAARAIISEAPMILIQGPPGTGKTHTLATAAAHWIKSGKRMVVSAPSNTAVDHLCHALLDLGIPILRVGNEEKMSDRVAPYTLDGYLEKGTTRQLFDHLRQSLRKAETKAEKYFRNPTGDAIRERTEARKERSNLRKEIRQFIRDEELRLIQEIPVIAGTPVGLFNALPKTFVTDVVVLDEAGQCPEPLAWLTASFGKRFVVCGDQQQLPPVVLSSKAQQLSKSLLEREGAHPVLLNEQYRMAPVIMNSINSTFYHDQLIAHPSVSQNGEIRFIDMAGYGDGEQQDELSGSTFCESEAFAVRRIIDQLGIHTSGTVILSPYNAQLELLKKQLPDFRISTIDAMQGQEAETIIISLTRSNPNGEIGFLKDYRRTNVAISRARRVCILVGDSATIGHDAFYDQLLGYIEKCGIYQSIWEFEQ